MAVSGADWRKPTDGYRTDTADRARFVRSETGGLSAAADPGIRGKGCAARRTLADNTDRSQGDNVQKTVETVDSAVSGPLAIGVNTGRAIVTEWPENGHADGNDIYMRYFYTRSGYSTTYGDRRMIHDYASGADGDRGRTTDQTVIIK